MAPPLLRSDPPDLPDSAFGLEFSTYLTKLDPGLGYVVAITTLKLLSAVRMSNMDDGDLLRSLARMEAALATAMSSFTTPQRPGGVRYSEPPKL